MNPAEMVPTLEIDGMVMTESMPICEYIEEAYPDQKPLLPIGSDAENLKKKFQIRRLCEIINSGTQPI